MTDTIPFPEHPKDLRNKIREIPDRKVVQRLEDHLTFIEAGWCFDKHEDIARMYAAIRDLVLHEIIPPKKGEVLLKIVNSAVQAKKLFCEIEFPEQLLQKANDAISYRDAAVLKAAETLMSADHFARFKAAFPVRSQLGKEDGKCRAEDR